MLKTGCPVAKIFPSRADLGVPQVADIINLPELVPNEKDLILSVAQRKFASPPDSPKWAAGKEPGRNARKCKGRRLAQRGSVRQFPHDPLSVRMTKRTPRFAALPNIADLWDGVC